MKYLALSLALVAGQAEALSCVQTDVARTFQSLAESDATYFILRGALSFKASEMPRGDREDGEEPDPVLGRFAGKGLSLNGFDIPVESSIILQPSCIGPWCGATHPSDDVLIFVREDPSSNAYVLDLDECHWQIFHNPTKEMTRRLVTCLEGGNCKPAN